MIECKICSCKGFLSLNSHLKHAHGMSCWEYLEKFPNSSITDVSVKESISKGSLGKSASWATRIRLSEASRNTIRSPHSEETKKKISEAQLGKPKSEAHKEAMRAAWTPERMNRHILEMESRWSDPNYALRVREKISETRKEQWASPEFVRYMKECWDASDRSQSLSNRHKALWRNLTLEEKEEKLRNSINSDEAIRNRMKALNQSPSMPERIVDRYLQKKYPGRWIYNGNYSQRVIVGNRIPDFILVEGGKEAISVMGCLGLGHFLGDDEEEVDYYRKHGWNCRVIWEWDIPGELDKILEEENKIV